MPRVFAFAFVSVIAAVAAGCSSGTSSAQVTTVTNVTQETQGTQETQHTVTATSAVATVASEIPASLPPTTPTSSAAPMSEIPASDTAAGPCGWSSAPPDRYDHVIWIWMENKNTDVLRSPQATFLASLVDQCGSATNYRDNGLHPSLPNYILATSGDAQGIDDDAGPNKNATTADNIFRQVRAIGASARSYLEAMDHNCQLAGGGRYAVKHNPAAYYVGGDDRAACARDAVPFDAFQQDLDSGTLPALALVSPDLCHDMHDCPIRAGDDWLRLVVSSITGSDTYRAGRTAVFIVWDESAGGGRMPFIAVAPTVPSGTAVDAALGHAALLAFTEDVLGIAEHLGAASDAPDLRALFGI